MSIAAGEYIRTAALESTGGFAIRSDDDVIVTIGIDIAGGGDRSPEACISHEVGHDERGADSRNIFDTL